MNVELPPAAGYAAAFVSGFRSVGVSSAIEPAVGVVVRRGFTIANGALVPDTAAPTAVALTDAVVSVSGTPWVTYESETAVAKHGADIIVLGARDAARAGWVSIGNSERLRRPADPLPQLDDDLRRNLFGFHPRAEPMRLNDARTLPQKPDAAPQPKPGDLLDRFSNAQRRGGVGGVISSPAALPLAGQLSVMHGPASGETQNKTIASVAYDLAAPRVTLYLHHGNGPDRAPRWCPHDRGAMTLDTLLLAPDAGKAAALWRLSWRWGDPGADTLRRIVVTGGAA